METVLIVSSILLWIVVLFNLVLTLALVRRANTASHHNSPSLDMLKAGQPAPDFTAQILSGEKVTLSSYAGHKMAFIFISTACVPCREFLPQLELLKPEAARAGVELALVSSNEIGETRAFAEKLNVSLPVLVAPRSTNPLFEEYKATLTPAYCLVNEQGVVQSAGLANLVGGEWEALTDSWKKNDVPVASERR